MPWSGLALWFLGLVPTSSFPRRFVVQPVRLTSGLVSANLDTCGYRLIPEHRCYISSRFLLGSRPRRCLLFCSSSEFSLIRYPAQMIAENVD
ncbi:hypothetical protein BDQ94DRAFT_145077 [Aspergillus welwitschiae]|uniref:Secreted protein n=1 Tax=Aspergillus welwitschiae TaxID=1341132 RepID=A0A3F3Q1C7_9EURO|nr:hypothetical protein BDQ94DRAFT_145077 [Aspergillus welwitschiae]RDH32807.1 hypothetical protein BDQ94DRAFT_145077 [Aspergillus welwitschiae]